MKVALITIYSKDMALTFEEIGISSISAYLRQHNHTVMLRGFKEKDVDYQELIDFNPKIVGFNVYSVSKKAVYRVIEKLKEVLPNTKICLGGYVPTFFDKEILFENGLVDYCVRGEGEETILDLVENMGNLKNVKGLTYRVDDKIIANESRPMIKDLDSLPLSSRDMLINNKLQVANISTSRGCTSKCSFCACPSIWKTWRGRDVKLVVDEIQYILENYGIDTFYFIDGSFHDPDVQGNRMRLLAEDIINRDLRISYLAGFRSDFSRHATPELMELLKKSGLCTAFVGIEAGTEEDLRIYNKRANMEDNHRVIELFNRYDICIEPGFINFNPYSTFDKLRKNVEFLKKYGFGATMGNYLRTLDAYTAASISKKIIEDGLSKETIDGDIKYDYVNKEIEQLNNFMHQIVRKINEENDDLFEHIDFFAGTYKEVFAVYKRKAKLTGNEAAIQVVIDNEKKRTKLEDFLCDNFAHWFNALVDLSIEGWDFEKAEDISYTILNSKEVHDTLNAYRKLARRLFVGLLKTKEKIEIVKYQ